MRKQIVAIVAFVAFFQFAFVCRSRPLYAVTPESPEVKEVIAKARKYLSDIKITSSAFGTHSLIALALIKAEAPKDHPKIKEAVKICRQRISLLSQNPPPNSVYGLCVSIIFLCELDAEGYAPEIKAMMDLLVNWQKPFGGWGYLQGPHMSTGDTSMTQYAVLSSWTADRFGVYSLRKDSMVRVCNWLIRTQDKGGGWGYQGHDPGSYERIEQEGVQNSLSAAGIGSIYMSGDSLRITKRVQRTRTGDSSLIKAVVKQPVDSGGPLTKDVDIGMFNRAVAGGDRWIKDHPSVFPADWPYYYLYALERYQSFRELANGRFEKSPAWYNNGFERLKRLQQENGSFEPDYNPALDTGFAILFLTRGTRKSIEKAEGFGGRLRGGKGLPTNTADVTIGDDGNIVKTPFQGQAETLLALLETAGDDLDELAGNIEIKLSSDPKKRQDELVRLRRLVSADEFAIRNAAIRALETTRDLENVPIFIYALGDPDRRVVLRARNSLRSLSRKFDGFGLPEDPEDGEKIEAIRKWKEWYLSLRPSAQFIE